MQGRFFLVGGGAAVRTPGSPYIGRFIAEAGGQSQTICLLVSGTEDQEIVNACYWDIFVEFGVSRLYSPQIRSREDAFDAAIAERVAECDAIFVAGGSQYRLMERLCDTPLSAAMRRICERGGILGGTSAGASIFAGPMILSGGNEDRHLRPDMVDVGFGMNFLGPDISIDTHCSSRGRLPRLLSLLFDSPQTLVIGLDEDTGLLVRAEEAEVFGVHSCYILDGRQLRRGRSGNGSHLSLRGVIMHSLSNGDRFHLPSREPIGRFGLQERV